MLHESEKFQFKVLLMGYLAIWLGLTSLPYVMDIGHWAGISRLWTHPMFSAFPALLWVVYGGSWIARWTDNEAWLLNRSFWAKQIFVLMFILSILLASELGQKGILFS